MFKVIVSLVVAMTATTALLTWAEPSTTAAQSLVPALAAEQAQRVVTTDVQMRLGRWHQIEVAVHPGLPGIRGNTLAAISSADQFHFLVGASGSVRATAAWVEQESIGEPTDVVRVGVACAANAAGLTASQRVTLGALLSELNHRCAPPDGWRPVSVRDRPDSHGRLGGFAGMLRIIFAEVGLTV